MADLLYKDESYKIIGACFEVYNQKGYGFIEPVYQVCLQIEFALQGIPFISQPEIRLSYKGNPLSQHFKPDFVCYRKIIGEIKSVAAIVAAHRAQAINYLNATEFELPLLVNFGLHPKLDYERLAKSKKTTILDEIRSWTEGSEDLT